MLATVNEPVTLSALAGDGRGDMFVQARLYNAAGTLVSTLTVPHVAEGLYQVSYTPTVEGYFSTIYQFYLDSGHTIDAGYEVNGESLDVNSFRTNILKLLGLVHENAVVDQQTYDGDGNLTGARIRAYDSAANADAAASVSPSAYNTGLKFQWRVAAEFSGGLLSKYSVIKVP